MNIYVASSWRNQGQPTIVSLLANMGHEVYDFRHPAAGNNGFHWTEIDARWKDWTPEECVDALDDPIAERGFAFDFAAMQRADAFVGVMPFGISASLEMGWAAGHGKPTALLLSDGEPELMVKMLTQICPNVDALVATVNAWADPH